MKEKIIVYDFDKTIYDGETSTDFMRFFLKRNKRYIIRFHFIFISFFFYFFNLKKSKEYFFSILKDLEIDFLKKEIKEFWKIKRKKIFSFVKDEIKENKKVSNRLILISATPSIFLEEISTQLGFDKLIATEFVKTDNYFNNKIEGENCKGKEKVNRLNKYIDNYEILSFYSDSMSDKPLFDLSKEKNYIIKGVKHKL